MNTVQRIILIAAGSLMALSCFYVPWIGGTIAHPRVMTLGYSLIWKPPTELDAISVDINRFLIQFIGLCLIAIITYLLVPLFDRKD